MIYGETVPRVSNTQRHLTMRAVRLRQDVPAALGSVLAEFAKEASFFLLVNVWFHSMNISVIVREARRHLNVHYVNQFATCNE